MSGLTDEDLKRIARFVDCPPDRRRPAMLCPDGGNADRRPGEAVDDA